MTAAQAAFVNQMIQTLATTAPAIDPAEVVSTGATLIRTVFPAEQVSGIVSAYMAGIKVALGISMGGAGLGLVFSLCSSWRRLSSEAVKDAIVAG